ncbi:MAG TPA: hypothetical protein VE441_12870 [Mycobacterium sp.]|nr:hypothetical protein [Mycobacterium sp.]
MFVTSHVLVGAAIGARTPNLVAACGLGVVSHFVLDAVPHWGSDGDHDYFMRVAVRDGLGGLAALAASAALSSPRSRWSVLAAAIGAATPDLDKPFAELTGRRLWPRPIDRFHRKIQRESPRRMRGELSAAAVAAMLTGVLVGRTRARR